MEASEEGGRQLEKGRWSVSRRKVAEIAAPGKGAVEFENCVKEESVTPRFR